MSNPVEGVFHGLSLVVACEARSSPAGEPYATMSGT